MDRRNRILLALLALAVAFWGGRSWLAHRPPPPPFTIAAFAPEDAGAIDVTYKGATLKLARKDDKRWTLIEPKKADADPQAIDAVLKMFQDPLVSDMLAAKGPKDLTPYGLDDDNRVHLVVRGKDKVLVDLELGKTVSGGAGFYRVTGTPEVYRGKLGSRYRLEKKADDWRDKRILDFKKEDVVELELRAGDQHFSFTRSEKDENDKDGTWAVLLPPALKVDPHMVDSVARGLGALRANELVDDPSAAGPAFAEPQVFVRVKLEDGSDWSVTFGAKKEEKKVWIRRDQDGAVFVVTEATMSRFQKQPKDLRDKAVLKFKRDDVALVTLHDDQGTWVVEPGPEDTWKAKSPAGYTVDPKEMTFTLNTLSNLRAAELLDDVAVERAGTRGKGSVAVDVAFKDGTARTLRLGPVSGDKEKKLQATVDGDKQVYGLREFTLNSVKRGFGKAPKMSLPQGGMKMGGPGGMPGGMGMPGMPQGLPPGVKLPPNLNLGR